MEEQKKIDELIDLSSKKVNFIKNLKTFINKSSYDEINDWLDTVDKTQLFFIMFEFSKDEDMAEELKIVEAYYKHNN